MLSSRTPLIALLCLAALPAVAGVRVQATADPNRVALLPGVAEGSAPDPGPIRVRLLAGDSESGGSGPKGCVTVLRRGRLRGRHYLEAEIAPGCGARELALTGAPLVRRAAGAPDPDPADRDWLSASFINYQPEFDPGPDPTPPEFARRPAAVVPWTVYCGSTPCLRIEVRAEGPQRVTAATLSGFGFPASYADPSVLRLMRGADEIPLKLIASNATPCGAANCTLGYLEFHGRPRTGEDEAGVWEGGDFTDGEPYFLSLVAPRAGAPRIADLSVLANKGYPVLGHFRTTLRRAARDYFAAQAPVPGETHFYDQMTSAYKDAGNNTVTRRLIFSSAIPVAHDVLFNVPKPAATQPASLAMRLTEKPVHFLPYNPSAIFRLQVKLNGVNPDAQPADWTGMTPITHTLAFPGSALAQSPTAACPGVSGGPMCLTLTPTRLATSGYDEHRIAAVELDYNRTFDATGEGNQLIFEIPNANSRIQITGLTSSGSTAILYEITDPAAPRRLTLFWASSFRADIDADAGCGCATRRFALSYDAAATVPAAQLALAPAPGLRNAASGANYLVIHHPDLITGQTPVNCPATGTTITPWACFVARKQAQFGAANVRLVSVLDIYNDYGSGVFDPRAIRDYLADALANWPAPKPQYLLLLGDGTVDTKDSFNRSATETTYKNWVPTLSYDLAGDTNSGYFHADAAFGDPDDDGLADVAVGRIPARTPAEAAAMLAKLNQHDAFAFYPYGAAKSWMARTALIADETIGGYDSFEQNANAWFAASPAPHEAPRYFYGPPPYNGNTADSAADFACALRGAMNGLHCTMDRATANTCTSGNPDFGKGTCKCDATGADGYRVSLLTFEGHGNQFQWGNDPFFTDQPTCRNNNKADTDASLLAPATPIPVQPTLRMAIFNCLSGAFGVISTFPPITKYDSLAEEALKLPGSGFIGGFAPSAITDASVPGVQMAAMRGLIHGPLKVRDWGAIVQSTRTAVSPGPAANNPAAFAHIDFGDPAQPLKMPAPAAPSGLAAVAGNAQVALSWSIAGLDANTLFVRIWRAQGSNPALEQFAPVACVPRAQTAYTDTAVTNAQPYRYALSGFDNYDGAHANCAGFEGARTASVGATPINPNPPASPAAPSVVDPGLGSVLNVSFAPNGESDLVYYTLRYGTASGAYPQSINLGLSTAISVSGLTEGTRYFFAVTATNSSGLTSGTGGEGSGIPRQLNGGLRAPGASADLRLSKSGGADLRADWTPVSTDYFGDPLNPALLSQTLFHHPGGFNFNINALPGAESEALSATAATFTHPGAQTGATTWAYMVLGRNGVADGSAGGALPRGVVDLSFRKSTVTAGRLNFYFTPATLDTAGRPLPAAPTYWIYRATSTPVPVDRTGAHTGALTSLTGAFCEGTARYCNDTDLGSPLSYFYAILVEDARGQSSPY